MTETQDYPKQIVEIDEQPEHLIKQRIRDAVHAQAGDPESMLGTTERKGLCGRITIH